MQIPIELIDDSPFQTRADYTGIEELAEDIARNGLLQYPVGRIIDGAGKVVNPTPYMQTGHMYRHVPADYRVQLALGHRRFRAVQHAHAAGMALPGMKPGTLLVTLRELTDEQMSAQTWSENMNRQDLSPIEQAESVRRRMFWFGWSQKRVAEHMGLDRSTVSNKLKILELPKKVQDLVREGKLSERKAAALLPMYSIPKDDLEHLGFQLRPSTMLRDAKWNSSDELRRRVKQAKEQIKAGRKRAAEAKKRQAELQEQPQGEVLSTRDLKYDAYDTVYGGADDPCAYGECPCFRAATDWNGKPVKICLNPNRRKGMKAKLTREERKRRRDQVEAWRKKVQKKLRPAGELVWTPYAAAWLAAEAMSSVSAKQMDALIASLPEEDQALFKKLRAGNSSDREHTRGRFIRAGLSMDTMLEIALLALLEREYAGYIEYTSRSKIKELDAILKAAPFDDVCAQTPAAATHGDGSTAEAEAWSAVLQWPKDHGSRAQALYKLGWMLYTNSEQEYQLRNHKAKTETPVSSEVGTLIKSIPEVPA